MDISLHGTPPTGASVTSGTISAHAALSAGDVTINTKAVPAFADPGTNAAQCDALVAAINAIQNQTGVLAVKVTSTTFKLQASKNIVVAALAGAATLANTGLTAATTNVGAMSILDTRKAFGTNPASPSDFDIVQYGNQWIQMSEAVELGLIFRLPDGTYGQTQAAAAPTRVDA